jgi:hypothetical protein
MKKLKSHTAKVGVILEEHMAMNERSIVRSRQSPKHSTAIVLNKCFSILFHTQKGRDQKAMNCIISKFKRNKQPYLPYSRIFRRGNKSDART